MLMWLGPSGLVSSTMVRSLCGFTVHEPAGWAWRDGALRGTSNTVNESNAGPPVTSYFAVRRYSIRATRTCPVPTGPRDQNATDLQKSPT
jgi:hypothetical protein